MIPKFPKALTLSLLLAACSKSPASEVASICNRFAACSVINAATNAPFTAVACEGDFEGWVPPSGCESTTASAPCAELTSADGGTWAATCFPSCSPTTTFPSCHDNEITQCIPLDTSDAGVATRGELVTDDCSSICSARSSSYTGTCAESYNGQSSTTGYPLCWCN